MNNTGQLMLENARYLRALEVIREVHDGPDPDAATLQRIDEILKELEL